MPLPLDLVLVRHGESEGNVASRRTLAGDNSCFTPEFLARHSSQWRLTDRGVRQAEAAGAWIRENLWTDFDRYYVSEYLRAKETAAHLGLPEAVWFSDFYLRERDRGDWDVITYEERINRYPESVREQEAEPFFWTPPNGESLAQLCLRIDRVLHTLHRECGQMRVIVVCHGEVMKAFRVRLERMTQKDYHALHASRDPQDRYRNGQVVHYTRRNPRDPGAEPAPYLNWVRTVCPWDPDPSADAWREIGRPRFTNEELLEEVRRVPRLVEG